MALSCPKCNARFHWYRIENSFSCPRCQTKLRAKATRLWVTTVILWGLAEIPLWFSTASLYDDLPAGYRIMGGMLFGIIDLSVGFLIGTFVFSEANIEE